MPPTTMDCPGCGKPNVSRALVACKPCWLGVPQALKVAVLRTPAGGMNRIRAIIAVREWLKENGRD